MRRKKYCLLLPCIAYKIADIDDLVRIEAGRCLIKAKNTWVVNERLGKAYSLPEPFRKSPDLLILLRGQSGCLNDIIDLLLCLFSKLINRSYETQVFPHVHFGIERIVLREIADGFPYLYIIG